MRGTHGIEQLQSFLLRRVSSHHTVAKGDIQLVLESSDSMYMNNS